MGDSDVCNVTAIFSIIVEEAAKRVRNVVVKAERILNNGKEFVVQVRKCICSCDISWTAGGISESSCVHVEELKRNELILDFVDGVIEPGFNETDVGTLVNSL